MAKEIERKYLVTNHSYREMAVSHYRIKQGYLSTDPQRIVRVRTSEDSGFLTVKGLTRGCTRDEFEYCIPLDDAEAMLGMCKGGIIDKIRYIVPYHGHTWEVDEFNNPNGITIAEVELQSENINYSLPPFVGEDVTGNPEYYNSALSSKTQGAPK